MATNTTNYNLIKPAVNDPADQDLWGGYLNESLDIIDGQMKINADGVAANTAAIAAFVGMPTGCILLHGADTPPTGYLECDGASVDTTTYASLFAVIGYTFGGSGSNFNLPDMRGQFARGWDNGAGVDSGRAFGSEQTDTVGAFSATINGAFQGWDVGGTPIGGSTGNRLGAQVSSSPQTATTISYAFSGGSETRPKNVALLYIIKT
jgi:microcystin-dependent protein